MGMEKNKHILKLAFYTYDMTQQFYSEVSKRNGNIYLQLVHKLIAKKLEIIQMFINSKWINKMG